MTDQVKTDSAKNGLRSKVAVPGSIGLIGHVVADFPSPAAARKMIRNMADAGVSIVEVQIPFSEPVADGPVFMAANHQALSSGVRVEDAFTLVHEVSAAHPQVDFVFMTYLNIVYKAGFTDFAVRAEKVGARAVIIPDLPFESCGPLEQAFAKNGVGNIRLVAPNSTNERLKHICETAKGFVYAVARSGVTGSATTIDSQLKDYTQRIRSYTDVPIGLGFGIRSPDDVKRLKGICDYAIIGTAALQAWLSGPTDGGGGDVRHREFWKNIGDAAHGP